MIRLPINWPANFTVRRQEHKPGQSTASAVYRVHGPLGAHVADVWKSMLYNWCWEGPAVGRRRTFPSMRAALRDLATRIAQCGDAVGLNARPLARVTPVQRDELLRCARDGSLPEGHAATYRVRNSLKAKGLLELFHGEPIDEHSLYRPTLWRLTPAGAELAATLRPGTNDQ